jgi:hypothetical protein
MFLLSSLFYVCLAVIMAALLHFVCGPFSVGRPHWTSVRWLPVTLSSVLKRLGSEAVFRLGLVMLNCRKLGFIPEVLGMSSSAWCLMAHRDYAASFLSPGGWTVGLRVALVQAGGDVT